MVELECEHTSVICAIGAATAHSCDQLPLSCLTPFAQRAAVGLASPRLARRKCVFRAAQRRFGRVVAPKWRARQAERTAVERSGLPLDDLSRGEGLSATHTLHTLDAARDRATRSPQRSKWNAVEAMFPPSEVTCSAINNEPLPERRAATSANHHVGAMIEHQFYASIRSGREKMTPVAKVESTLRSGIAQLVEQRPVKAMVGGSSPPAGAEAPRSAP